MTDFLAAHREAPAGLPVAFFTMRMFSLGYDREAVAKRAEYTAKAKAVVVPVDKVFFPGKIDPARLSFVDRLLVRMVKSPVGDKRDWAGRETWADALAGRLA